MLSGRLRDAFQFAKKITLQRGFNAIQVLSSYYISRVLRRPVQWGLPISISIEPTTSCNLRCPECPSGLRAFSRNTGMLQPAVFENIIGQLHKKTPYLILYFQGEPYLNKLFFDYVQYAAQKKMYVATSTNAHYLTEENARKTVESGLSRLIISIDGSTQQTYQSYRIGGNINKVLEGAQRVVEWKRKLKSATPHIIFQFLVVKHNEHQVEEIQQIAKEIGVDEVKFKTAQVYNYEDGNELIPENKKYSRYRKNKKTGKYEIKNPLLNHCWKLWHACVFTWDGKVVPCCFDKDAKYTLGDAQQILFKDIWRSNGYNSFRGSVLKARKEIDICSNCTEGTQIWI